MRTFALIGGDGRQTALAALLREDGQRVLVCAGETETCPLKKAAEEAEILLLPLPVSRDGTRISGSGETPALTEVLDAARPEQLLLGGQFRGADFGAAAERGLRLRDYFLREELTVRNAVATAEGALQLAMERLPITLSGANVLVLGAGRIATLLAHDLHALGARVTVAARKAGDLARMEAAGCAARPLADLTGTLARTELVLNTAPAPVFGEAYLAELPEHCLCIDLASVPGIDPQAAARLGRTLLWARGLPGKTAPLTAARAIRDTVYHMLEEEA